MNSQAASDIRPGVVRFTRPRPAWISIDRGLTLLVFIGNLAVLLTAALLTPDAKGMGTHQSLGLPPCGFQATTGMPCASCGMTTAFAHAANGNLWVSFKTQPAGMMLAVVAAMTVLITGYSLMTRVSLGRLVQRLVTPWSFGTAVAILLGSWVYKILLVKDALPHL